jgi:hypothetical protein
MIAAAGRKHVPFTSGILIGIGETRLERVLSLLALRDLHRVAGHIPMIAANVSDAAIELHKAGKVRIHSPAHALSACVGGSAHIAIVMFGGRFRSTDGWMVAASAHLAGVRMCPAAIFPGLNKAAVLCFRRSKAASRCSPARAISSRRTCCLKGTTS